MSLYPIVNFQHKEILFGTQKTVNVSDCHCNPSALYLSVNDRNRYFTEMPKPVSVGLESRTMTETKCSAVTPKYHRNNTETVLFRQKRCISAEKVDFGQKNKFWVILFINRNMLISAKIDCFGSISAISVEFWCFGRSPE